MAKIRLRLMGSPGAEHPDEAVEVKGVGEVLHRLELMYPPDYYTLAVLVNGKKVDESSITFQEGDEVTVIPVMSGG